MCVCTCVLTWRMEKVVYLLPYLLEAGSLTEPGTRLAASKPSDLPVSPPLPHGLGIWIQFLLLVQQVLCCVREGLVVGVLKPFLGTSILTPGLRSLRPVVLKAWQLSETPQLLWYFILLQPQCSVLCFCYPSCSSCFSNCSAASWAMTAVTVASFGDASTLPLLLSATSLYFFCFIYYCLCVEVKREKMYMCACRWLS